MDVRNCRICDKLFNYIGGQPICPTCVRNLEEKFQQVRDYILDNPKASITEISEANEVSVNQISRWIKEERLSFSEESLVGVECECCGVTIKTGRFCQKCKGNLQHQLGKSIETEKKPNKKKVENTPPKMRFLDR